MGKVTIVTAVHEGISDFIDKQDALVIKVSIFSTVLNQCDLG